MQMLHLFGHVPANATPEAHAAAQILAETLSLARIFMTQGKIT